MSAIFPPALITAVCSARWSMPSADIAAQHGVTRNQVWHLWHTHRGLIPARPSMGEDDHLGTGLSATLYRALKEAGERGVTVDDLAALTYAGRPPARYARAIQKRLHNLRVRLPEGWSVVLAHGDRYVLARVEKPERALPPPERPVGLAEGFGVTAVERRVGDAVVSLARVRFLDGVAA